MTNGELLVVAGEASGDLHAADVLRELRRREPGLRAFGMGGERLAEAGLQRLFDAREISVMGFAEVWPRLPRIWRVFRTAGPGRPGADGRRRRCWSTFRTSISGWRASSRRWESRWSST